MKKIAILASGEGTNAERIIRYFAAHPTVKVVVVITNKAEAGVIRRAENLGIPVEFLPASAFKEGKATDVLRHYETDFVVLAGFLLRIPDDMLAEYPDRIVNIHPSLLPKFGGKGMYGSRVHEAVLEAKEQESGITIHYINEHYDEGAIILQAKCPVIEGDTPGTLANRVHQLEYEHYPAVIEKLLTSEKNRFL
ncbi:MAG: phosphoribosylglycinamide formyltransferase [Bacteroides sp.]|nr:phosphoribosylglycinamide formyltransferase [Bacteroides sp.]